MPTTLLLAQPPPHWIFRPSYGPELKKTSHLTELAHSGAAKSVLPCDNYNQELHENDKHAIRRS